MAFINPNKNKNHSQFCHEFDEELILTTYVFYLFMYHYVFYMLLRAVWM